MEDKGKKEECTRNFHWKKASDRQANLVLLVL